MTKTEKRLVLIILGMIAILFALWPIFNNLHAAVLKVAPTKDTYVWSGLGGGNYSASNVTRWDFGVASLEFQAFLEFDLSALSGATIDSAFIKLHVNTDSSAGSGNDTMWLYRNSTSWTESTITWDTRPTEGDSIARDSTPYWNAVAYVTPLEFGSSTSGLKQWLQNIADGTWTNYGFRIKRKALNGNAQKAFDDRTTATPETLTVYYTAGAGTSPTKKIGKVKLGKVKL